MNSRYIALIPAYEPDEKMLCLIDELSKRGFDIVVVDDGSGRDHEDIFLRAEEKAVVLTHAENRGKGAALKTGLRYIEKYMAYCETTVTPGGAVSISGKDAVIVTVDADGQHRPDDVERVAGISRQNKNAMVLGSRALAEGTPLRSKMGNTITRYVYKLATGVPVHDTQTGLRAFRISMIPLLLEIEGERYEYEMNVLLKLASGGTTIIEEEIETVYEDNNSGSHFRTVKDAARVYKEILRFSASSIVSFLIDYAAYAGFLILTGAAEISNGLIISNIAARLISGTANYTMNRKLVFRSRSGIARSASQYAMLAGSILAGNTLVLSVLTGTLGINSYLAKVITEIVFFAISWTVQKYVIFFGDEKNSTENGRHAKLGAQER